MRTAYERFNFDISHLVLVAEQFLRFLRYVNLVRFRVGLKLLSEANVDPKETEPGSR